jgi:copper(I)-binding protein
MRAMRKLAGSIVVAIALLAGAGCGASGTRIEHAWARAAERGATTAAYFTLVNGGPDTLHVTGVSGDAAESIAMHTSVHVGNMVTMREAGSFEVAPGSRLVFAPGGNHVMLTHLRAPLTPGSRVNLALHVSGQPDLPVIASVRR